MKKIIIAGGSGFLGQALIDFYLTKKYSVVVLTRKQHLTSTQKKLKYMPWDGKQIGPWTHELENAYALINLSGKSVDCRYTDKNKREILNSRVLSTQLLGKAITNCNVPPKFWVNASTATIYEHSLDTKMTEANGVIGNDFSMNVAKTWEQAFFENTHPKTQKIALRTSIVLGKNGGAFIPLKKLTLLGLGGKQGKGTQKVSWIHEHDFCRAVDFLMENNKFGVFNVTVPNPISNREFMKKLRKALKVPFGLPQPAWLLKIGAALIGTEAELILKSRNVIPEKLINEGFQFKYTNLTSAVQEIIKR